MTRVLSRVRIPVLLALAAAAGSGCASLPLRPWESPVDRGYLAVSRSLADVVDRIDTKLGDARAQDRLVRMRVSTGVATTYDSDGDVHVQGSFQGRVPLPAIQRRSNLYFDVGGNVAYDDVSSPSDLGAQRENYQAALAIQSSLDKPVNFGLRLSTRWQDGVQTNIRPYVRWEKRRDPWRWYASEEVFKRSDRGFGEKTYGHVDYLVGDAGFGRFLTEVAWREEVTGVDIRHAAMFRHETWEGGAASIEAGYVWNPEVPERERFYNQLRLVTKVWRPWLEVELRPRVTRYLEGDREIDWSILLGVSVTFEDYLRGD